MGTVNYKGTAVRATATLGLGGVDITQWPVLRPEVDTIKTNIMLNAFRIAIQGGLSLLGMIDGIVDEFEDETGIDTAQSVDEVYDAGGDFYHNQDTGSVVHAANAVSTGDLSQYTFASQSLGTAAPDRLIVIAVGFNAASPPTTTGVTVAGSAATLVKSQTGGNKKMELWQVALPTGTSGDVVVSLDGAALRCGIGVFALYGVSATAHDTGGSAASPLTDTLDIPARGVAIGAAYWSRATASTITWSNLTEKYDEMIEAGVIFHSAAAAAFATQQTGLTITGTMTQTEDQQVMAIASWGPAPANDMALFSESVIAAAQPDEAHLVLFEEDVDAVTENTDLKGWASRDDGRAFTTDFATDDKLDLTTHGFANGDRVTVESSGTLPAGLSAGVLYYVVNQTANDFELSLTSGGGAVDITDNGSGTHKVFKWDQATLADEGDYIPNQRILSGTQDVSGQPAGINMRYLVTTHNNKELKLHGAALEWK